MPAACAALDPSLRRTILASGYRSARSYSGCGEFWLVKKPETLPILGFAAGVTVRHMGLRRTSER
jgi:hypothetical protein